MSASKATHQTLVAREIFLKTRTGIASSCDKSILSLLTIALNCAILFVFILTLSSKENSFEEKVDEKLTYKTITRKNDWKTCDPLASKNHIICTIFCYFRLLTNFYSHIRKEEEKHLGEKWPRKERKKSFAWFFSLLWSSISGLFHDSMNLSKTKEKKLFCVTWKKWRSGLGFSLSALSFVYELCETFLLRRE